MIDDMEMYAASVLAQVQLAYEGSPALAYVLIALGTTCFGNLVAVPAVLLGFDGTLGSRGFFGVPLAVLAGHVLGDIVWFSLGRFLADTRPGRWLRAQLPVHERVQRFFDSGSVYILALSKLLATPTVPILFMLGWYQTVPTRYARLSVISAGIWFVGLLAFCGAVYSGLRIVF